MPANGKTKVCILGGGAAGLATAFALTDTPELREAYQVTLYQVGWRAAGKCGSGREGDENSLEQNCAHYLFGCYDNTFDMARKAYTELTDVYNYTQFQDFNSVLLPRDLIVLMQKFEGTWQPWLMEMPSNSKTPGSQDNVEMLDYITMVLEIILEGVFGWKFIQKLNHFEAENFQHDLDHFRDREHTAIEIVLLKTMALFIRAIMGLTKFRHTKKRVWLDKSIAWVLSKIRSLVWLYYKGKLDGNLKRQQAWTMFDYGSTIVIGVLRDEVMHEGGVEKIDEYDFIDWLEMHGATKWGTNSPSVIMWYQMSLAYVDGKTDRPKMSAGISILGQFRSMFTYKGNVAYSLKNEVADSLFAPIYLLLKERGVQFNFFHRVRDVVANGAFDSIDRIEIERQVDLKGGASPDSYFPLKEAAGNGVDSTPYFCWPAEPFIDQFSDADKAIYEAGDYDLESFYTDWPRKTNSTFTLKQGVDFEKVVFAMPHATIKFYCKDIYDNKPSWKALYDENPTMESQSMRLWLSYDLEALGFEYPVPIVAGYAMRFCNWLDDSQLLEGQSWPHINPPQTVACLFGPLDAPTFPPGPTDIQYLRDQELKAENYANNFDLSGIWPGAALNGGPNGIGGAIVVRKSVRGNIGPNERYTMCWPGKLKTRPRAGESGLQHLYFAGDWVRTGLDAGTTESAVMAGFQASREISGYPEKVPGEEGMSG